MPGLRFGAALGALLCLTACDDPEPIDLGPLVPPADLGPDDDPLDAGVDCDTTLGPMVFGVDRGSEFTPLACGDVLDTQLLDETPTLRFMVRTDRDFEGIEEVAVQGECFVPGSGDTPCFSTFVPARTVFPHFDDVSYDVPVRVLMPSLSDGGTTDLVVLVAVLFGPGDGQELRGNSVPVRIRHTP